MPSRVSCLQERLHHRFAVRRELGDPRLQLGLLGLGEICLQCAQRLVELLQFGAGRRSAASSCRGRNCDITPGAFPAARGAPRGLSGSAIVGPVGAVHAGEDRLQAVVILLRDRVELVVVAAGAMRRHADERGHGGHHHVVAIQQARDVLVGGAFAQFRVADEIPRAGGDEAGGHGRLADRPATARRRRVAPRRSARTACPG